MKKKIVFWASILLGVILMFLIYQKREDIFSPFTGAPLVLLIPYLGIVVLIHVFHVWRWDIILKTMGHSVPFGNLFKFRIMGYSINYITPTAHIGGEPLKAVMLKENNVQYTEGVSSILIDKSFELFADGLLSIIGVIILTLSFALPKELWNSFLIISVISMIVLLKVFFRLFKKDKPFLSIYRMFRLNKVKYLKAFEDKIEKTDQNITDFFVKHRKYFWASITLSFLMWVLMFVEYKLLLLMLGFNAGFLELFVIISFVGLAYFIPIPAALGVLEAGQLSAFAILGLSTSLGIATSLIIRAKDIIITIIGMILLSIKGIAYRKKTKNT